MSNFEYKNWIVDLYGVSVAVIIAPALLVYYLHHKTESLDAVFYILDIILCLIALKVSIYKKPSLEKK